MCCLKENTCHVWTEKINVPKAKSKLHHLLGLIFRIDSTLLPSPLLVWIEDCFLYFKSNLFLALQ